MYRVFCNKTTNNNKNIASCGRFLTNLCFFFCFSISACLASIPWRLGWNSSKSYLQGVEGEPGKWTSHGRVWTSCQRCKSLGGYHASTIRANIFRFKFSCWNGFVVRCHGWTLAKPTIRWLASRRNWKSTERTVASTSRHVSNKRPNWKRTSIRCKRNCVCPIVRRTCRPKAKWCRTFQTTGKVWSWPRKPSKIGFWPKQCAWSVSNIWPRSSSIRWVKEILSNRGKF